MSEKSDTVRQRPTDSGSTATRGDDGYDPHEHRQVPNATTNFETLVHLLKCSLGTGILAMPQAFSRAGLITGIVATVVIGAIVTHCLRVLVRSQYALCKREHVPLLTYTVSMTVALGIGPPVLKKFSRCSAILVDFFLVVYQLGVCCVYIVFIARTIKGMVDPYSKISLEIHMLIILGPIIGINCIRNLKALAPWSIVANLLTLIGLGIILYYLLADKKSQEKLEMFGAIADFPLFFGTTLFALTAVGVVVSLENNMKTPKSFGTPLGVLNVGMSFIVLLYVLVGALGYVYCSSECSDSITLDLPRGPLYITVMVMYAIAIFISYALQCYVPVDILWHYYMLPRLEKRGTTRFLMWEYILRIFLCLLTFALAVSVPQLGLFISLFGALCLSALGMIFPALMEICVAYPSKMFGPGKITLIKDVVLIILGVVGMISGTVTTLIAIIATFGK